MTVAWAVLYGYFLLSGTSAGLYHGMAVEPAPAAQLLCRIGFLAAISAWFTGYAREHRMGLPMDIGMFLWAASFAVVPYFVFRAEGRGGWRTLGKVLAPVAASILVQWSIAWWCSSLREVEGP